MSLVFNSPFISGNYQLLSIPEDVDIIFVSDIFVEDYPFGGAEKTSEALIKSAPISVFKLHSKNVTMELLEQGYEKYWIFGNFTAMNKDLIPSIVANLKYSIIEYDYKYCKYRSVEKHKSIENTECNCQNDISGKLISSFFYGAKSLFWMSEKQMDKYHQLFPFLSERHNMVLSSVFDDVFFTKIKLLKQKYQGVEKEDIWLVYDSNSWIKGTQEAINHCVSNNKKYKLITNLPYDEVLEEMTRAKGVVYTPLGGDTCPRFVIEAKLLECKLALNEYVEHKDEEWFSSSDLLDTESYLYLSRNRFWNGIKADMEYQPTISAYTTTRNCIAQQYPMEECLASVDFCDEIIVVDTSDIDKTTGKSVDGTLERLQAIAALSNNKIIVHHEDFDRESLIRPSLLDGRTKALARSLATKDYCLQIDGDEIIHEDDIPKYKRMVRDFPKAMDIVSLPMIEYFSDKGSVRIDINVSKWRISRNKPYITHGIPLQARKFDNNGELYSKEFASDGCDLIHFQTFESLPFLTFLTEDVERLRINALNGDENALKEVENWFSNVTDHIPSVHHYGWYKLESKLKKYSGTNKGFFGWQNHWNDLYNKNKEDLSENNMFIPGKAWKDVTEEDINQLINDFELYGPRIMHWPFNKDKIIPTIKVKRTHPKFIQEWLKK